MSWHFYWKRLIYVSPYWLFIIAVAFTIIGTSLEKTHALPTQIFFILSITVIPAVFWWLMTPFTFLFLESFRPIKALISCQKIPPIIFNKNTSFFLRIFSTVLAFLMRKNMELITYMFICGLVIPLSFIISPLVIVILMMENLLKKLPIDRI
jgi:hypothetical protein